jgi:vancomycin resistance protein YoaR
MLRIVYILLFSLALAKTSVVLAATSQPNSSTLKQTPSSLTITVDNFSETIPQDTLGGWLLHDPSIKLDNTYRTEFENASFCPSSLIACSLLITTEQKKHFRYFSKLRISKDGINSYIEDLGRRVNKDPSNAKFQIENGKVGAFQQAQPGLTLKNNESVEMLFTALEKYSVQNPQTLLFPFDLKDSESNYKDINDLGISALIGQGSSNFKGSPGNRIHNIKVAVEKFNGVLIKPGENFSFVKTLGDVDAEHGYLPELVIKGDKTEPDFGGGICQVSTTMFRAALYSGLKITNRRNHAYPVSYYNPQGMDATVYVPQPDFKFTNNTPNHILVQVRIEGTQLLFDFYGTDDGRKSTIEGPTVTEKQPDGSMKTTFTQHVINKDGLEFIKDIFNSNYDSPYRHPHPGGPVLTAKPANWSEDEWKSYKKMIKEMNKAAASQNTTKKKN